MTFTPPASNGGSAITSYTATASPGGKTVSGSGSPLKVTGLTNGTSYTLTVSATNALGTGVPSASSNAVTPATVPGCPVIGMATSGNSQATVSFTAPASNGGSPILYYTVTSQPGLKTATGSASPITVTGLVNRMAYGFTVTATNAMGTSAASAISNQVIVGLSPSTGPKCLDSDGGMVPLVAGSVAYLGQSFSDRCSTTGFLSEYYCDTVKDVPLVKVVKCSAGCFNNACKGGYAAMSTLKTKTLQRRTRRALRKRRAPGGCCCGGAVLRSRGTRTAHERVCAKVPGRFVRISPARIINRAGEAQHGVGVLFGDQKSRGVQIGTFVRDRAFLFLFVRLPISASSSSTD